MVLLGPLAREGFVHSAAGWREYDRSRRRCPRRCVVRPVPVSTTRPGRFVDGGETIVAIGTYSGTHSETGESFEAAFTHVWDLEDGQVIELQQYIDTVRYTAPLEARSHGYRFGDVLPGSS